MNKIKIPHFLLILVRAYGLKREREKIRREEEEEGRRKKEEGRRKKEKKKKFRYGNYLCKETIVWNSCSEVWNTCLDICKETIVRMLVWNCLETLVLEIFVQVGLGKP